MTASSPSFTATDSASAGPTVSGLRSPMIESSIFLPGPFTAERPVMTSHDKRDVPSASPFRLRVVNAIALAGSAVRIETRGVDARRAARSAARNSSVFRIISILLVILDWQAGGPHYAEDGCLEGAKEGYAVGLTEKKGDVVPGPPAKGLFNYVIGTASQDTRCVKKRPCDQRRSSLTSDSGRSGMTGAISMARSTKPLRSSARIMLRHASQAAQSASLALAMVP